MIIPNIKSAPYNNKKLPLFIIRKYIDQYKVIGGIKEPPLCHAILIFFPVFPSLSYFIIIMLRLCPKSIYRTYIIQQYNYHN